MKRFNVMHGQNFIEAARLGEYVLQKDAAQEIALRDRRIAELEAELAALVHPFDLAAYREKNLHK